MAFAGVHNRSALGATAKLGDLYDIRRDDFCGISLFKRDLPNKVVTLVDRPDSKIHFVHTESFSEKFKNLNVDAGMSVSILTGMVKLEGSGLYLQDEKTSARAVKSSLIYNIETMHESVNIRHEDLTEVFDLDAIASGVGTHVVTEIIWGASAILSCSYENTEDRDTKELKGKLSATLKEIQGVLSAEGAGNSSAKAGDTKMDTTFDVRVYGDVLSQKEDLPTNVETALAFIKRLPSLVGNSNRGKGKPLAYRLLPLSSLPTRLSVAIKTEQLLCRLDETSLDDIVQLFDEINLAQQKLNDFCQDVNDYSFCVLPGDLQAVTLYKRTVRRQMLSFRSKLSTTVTEIRSGAKPNTEIEVLVETCENSDYSSGSIERKLTEWEDTMEKIRFAKFLMKQGIKHVGSKASLQTELLEDYDRVVYVLVFTKEAKVGDVDRWKKNLNLFLEKSSNRTGNDRFYAVDGDIHPNLVVGGRKSCVQLVKETTVVEQDLLTVETAEIAAKVINESSESVNNLELDRQNFGMSELWWESHSNGSTPSHNAVVAGDRKGKLVYVARVRVRGWSGSITGLVLGQFIEGNQVASYPLGGKEHFSDKYEILTATPKTYKWVSTSGWNYPKGSVQAGWCPHSQHEYYVGRGVKEGLMTAGKVIGRYFFPFDGREQSQGDYEILVLN